MAEQYPNFDKANDGLAYYQEQSSYDLAKSLFLKGEILAAGIAATQNAASTSALLYGGFYFVETGPETVFADLQSNFVDEVRIATMETNAALVPYLFGFQGFNPNANPDVSYLTTDYIVGAAQESLKYEPRLSYRPTNGIYEGSSALNSVTPFLPGSNVTTGLAADPTDQQIYLSYTGQVVDAGIVRSNALVQAQLFKVEYVIGRQPGETQRQGLQYVFEDASVPLYSSTDFYEEQNGESAERLETAIKGYNNAFRNYGPTSGYGDVYALFDLLIDGLISNPDQYYIAPPVSSLAGVYEMMVTNPSDFGVFYASLLSEDGYWEETLPTYAQETPDPNEAGVPTITQNENGAVLRSRQGSAADGEAADFSVYQDQDSGDYYTVVMENDGAKSGYDNTSLDSRDAVLLDQDDYYLKTKHGQARDGQITDLSLNHDGSLSLNIDDAQGTENRSAALFGDGSLTGVEDPVGAIRSAPIGTLPQFVSQEQKDQAKAEFDPYYNETTDPVTRDPALMATNFFDESANATEHYGKGDKTYEAGETYYEHHLDYFAATDDNGTYDGVTTMSAKPTNFSFVLLNATTDSAGYTSGGSSLYLPSLNDVYEPTANNIKYLTSVNEMSALALNPLDYQPGPANDGVDLTGAFAGDPLWEYNWSRPAYDLTYEYGSEGVTPNLSEQGETSVILFGLNTIAADETGFESFNTLNEFYVDPINGSFDYADALAADLIALS